MCEHVDEDANFRREMMAMRINRIHRQFDRPIFRQQANQPAGFEVVVDQKTGGARNATPCRAVIRNVSPLLVIRLPATRTEAGTPLRSTNRHSS